MSGFRVLGVKHADLSLLFQREMDLFLSESIVRLHSCVLLLAKQESGWGLMSNFGHSSLERTILNLSKYL